MGRIRADKCNTVHDRARLSGAVPSTLYAALSVGGIFVFFLTSAEQRSCLQYICTYKNSDRKREYAP